ncbi:hypothetical protein MBLNU459_g8411t1 [Dothideomycetes sp. NU459]
MSSAPDQQTESSAPPPSKRVYVGNLPYHAQAADVETYLSEAGFQIERLDMSTDPFTGRNPSYCFVELPSAAEAQRAIQELPGASFMGRPLRVNVHIPRRNGGTPSSNSSPRPPMKSYDSSGWRAQTAETRGSPAAGASPAFDRWSRRDEAAPAPRWTQSAQQPQQQQQQSKRLYVGGLPQIEGQDVVEQAMHELFAAFTVEAVSKLIAPHESKQALPGSHHYCFVDLASTDEAEAAMKALDGRPAQWGGSFRVSMARDRQDRKVVRDQGLASSAESPAPSPKPARDFSGSWRRAA